MTNMSEPSGRERSNGCLGPCRGAMPSLHMREGATPVQVLAGHGDRVVHEEQEPEQRARRARPSAASNFWGRPRRMPTANAEGRRTDPIGAGGRPSGPALSTPRRQPSYAEAARRPSSAYIGYGLYWLWGMGLWGMGLWGIGLWAI